VSRSARWSSRSWWCRCASSEGLARGTFGAIRRHLLVLAWVGAAVAPLGFGSLVGESTYRARADGAWVQVSVPDRCEQVVLTSSVTCQGATWQADSSDVEGTLELARSDLDNDARPTVWRRQPW
jgi:hypothetical protein